MKARLYKVEMAVLVLEQEFRFDGKLNQHVKDEIERSCNRYLSVHVKDMKTYDIDEWNDDHPYNKYSTQEEFYQNCFK